MNIEQNKIGQLHRRSIRNFSNLDQVTVAPALVDVGREWNYFQKCGRLGKGVVKWLRLADAFMDGP